MYRFINGRKIYGGGYSPPLRSFLIYDFVLWDMKKFFCQCYQNYLRHLWLKFFTFQMSGRWFPWHLKGGCTTPHKSCGVFSEILATASRLNTLYGIETWYIQSSRRVLIMKNFLRHIRHFWRIYDVINVGFWRHSGAFGYRKCHRICRNSWFLHGICVLFCQV